MRKKTFTFLLIGISFLLLTFFVPSISEAQLSCPVGPDYACRFPDCLDGEAGESGFSCVDPLICCHRLPNPTANIEVCHRDCLDPRNWSNGPITVPIGDTVTLEWASTDADDCVALFGVVGWSGSKGQSGTEVVTVNSNNTYSIRCSNPALGATASVTVNVGAGPLPTTCVGERGVCMMSSRECVTVARGYCLTSSPLDCVMPEFPCCCVIPRITLYENINYGGRSISFSSDDNNLSDDEGPCLKASCTTDSGNCWNDCASSVRVSSGYEVILYADSGFGSTFLTLTSDDSTLVDDGLNDRVSSIRVAAAPPPPPPPPPPSGGGNGFSIENPLSAESLEELVENLIDFIFKIALVLTPLMIIIAGFLLVTAGGSIEQVTKAKRIILWAVIGFLIVLLAKGIVAIIKGLLG